MGEASAVRVQTVVIGGGQAGLSVGYHLRTSGLPFLILESHGRIGDSWRERWDTLRLFTPARFDGLDGMPFPAAPDAFPTKDEMAAYLEVYASRFELPVRTGVKVERLSRRGDRFLVEALGGERFEAENVVVAMATYQRPRLPACAADLDPGVLQLHSSAYRNLAQLRPGGVLVVGAGNSGAELALECARGGHPTWLSGRNVGQLPFRIGGRVSRLFLARLVLRGIFHRLLTLDTPLGRKARPVVISRGGPLIRVKWEDLAALGVERVPRLAGLRDGHPELEGGRVLPVANVIWCTGFNPGFSWIDLPIFDPDGEPRQRRGAVPEAPGLYFVGLHFLYAMSSTMIHGVGRDAEHVARTIEARVRAAADAGEDVTERRPGPTGAAPRAAPARAAMPPRAGPGQPGPETRRA